MFALYACVGRGFARDSAAGPVGTGMLLGMLGFGLLWLAEMPVDLSSLWWDRRHDVSARRLLASRLRRLARARRASSSSSASRSRS